MLLVRAGGLKGSAPAASLGGGGSVVEVVIPLRDGIHADAVLHELRSSFSGSYTSYRVRDFAPC